MKRILMIDDDEGIRKLVRMRLADTYQVVDTGDPAQALELALEHQPDAIILDVMMPRLSGFDLCRNLRALTYTSTIPIFVISGGGDLRNKYQEHCQRIGAKAYIDKPIDFAQLKAKLAEELEKGRPERRSEVRIRMHLTLKLRGVEGDTDFEELVRTEDVSPTGFLASCSRSLVKGTVVDVFHMRGSALYVGRARVARKEPGSTAGQSYGFQFEETTADWVMHQYKC